MVGKFLTEDMFACFELCRTRGSKVRQVLGPGDKSRTDGYLLRAGKSQVAPGSWMIGGESMMGIGCHGDPPSYLANLGSLDQRSGVQNQRQARELSRYLMPRPVEQHWTLHLLKMPVAKPTPLLGRHPQRGDVHSEGLLDVASTPSCLRFCPSPDR
jgi:hypothetical protein